MGSYKRCINRELRFLGIKKEAFASYVNIFQVPGFKI